MTIAVYTRTPAARENERVTALLEALEASGNLVVQVKDDDALPAGTDMLLAVGGDGTFLSAASVVGASGIPVAGVNVGRLGFLSENRPEDLAGPVSKGDYVIEERSLVKVSVEGMEIPKPCALNEIGVHRIGGAMLGIDVKVDGKELPTYWADGLLVATSSGSTAYSLSVGGPIVTPDSKVLIVSPIAPHNLNVRPLVVPDTTEISMRFRSREPSISLTVDNRTCGIPASCELKVSLAQFSLKRLRLENSDFISALTSKLFWGEDIRNGR